jgi:hypothetical protein
MKRLNQNILTRAIFAIAATLVLTSPLLAYPPDNAAVLYYRAYMIYDANDAMIDKVTKYIKGQIHLDDEIRSYIEKNEYAIKQIVDAGQSPHCDWGLDYSEGIELTLPQYAPLRNICKIVLAKAKIACDSQDYALALDLCLSVHKTGLHAENDGILISHLVGISLNALANQTISDILPNIAHDQDTLLWLRAQLLDITGRLPSIKAAINRDLTISGQDLRKEKADLILALCCEGVSEDVAQIIKNGDDAFFDAGRKYFMQYLSNVLTAIDLPFPQSYEQLEKIAKQPSIDKKTDPSAILSDIFAPAIGKVLCLDIRNKTHFNAVDTAISLYITKAKTGKLPDELPNDMPKDLFSGKDFKYEKKKDSFVLSCQAKDPSRDKSYNYEFKIK